MALTYNWSRIIAQLPRKKDGNGSGIDQLIQKLAVERNRVY